MILTTNVIYVDSLLVVNFSMDYLALYISARLMHSTAHPLRLALSSAIGALYALTAVIAEPYTVHFLPKLLLYVLGIVFIYIMTAISFSKVPKEAFKCGITFIAVSVGLGGVMTVLYSMLARFTALRNISFTESAPESSPMVFILVAIISGLISLIYGRVSEQSLKKKKINATVTLFGTDFNLTLLCDSANMLKEPICGKPVVVVGEKIIKDKLPRELYEAISTPIQAYELSMDLARKIRIIPAMGVMGNGIMLGLMPDKITENGRYLDAVVAIDPLNNDFGGCDGIIPTCLL